MSKPPIVTAVTTLGPGVRLGDTRVRVDLSNGSHFVALVQDDYPFTKPMGELPSFIGKSALEVWNYCQRELTRNLYRPKWPD